jgi:hypothetical protein
MNPVRILFFCAVLLTLVGCAPPRVGSDPPVPRHPFTRWHRAYYWATPWRLTSAGVEIKGSGIERSAGRPKTVTWIWETYHESINRWSGYYQVPAELIVAVIATESAPARGEPPYTRDPKSLRRERGFRSLTATPHQLAVGLMQVTVGTARAVMSREGIPADQVDDRWLMIPDNAIRAGTALIARQARGDFSNVATLYDPPVAIAAFHAGGLYHMGGWKNRWKMRQYPPRTGRHLDRAVRYFNDAVAVLRNHRIAPVIGYREYVYNPPEWTQASILAILRDRPA